MKNVKYDDLENVVFKFQLTYNEVTDMLKIKYIPTKRTSCSLNRGNYEVVDLNITLINILPDNVKVSATIDDARLKSNSKNYQTLIFTKKSFFILY